LSRSSLVYAYRRLCLEAVMSCPPCRTSPVLLAALSKFSGPGKHVLDQPGDLRFLNEVESGRLRISYLSFGRFPVSLPQFSLIFYFHPMSTYWPSTLTPLSCNVCPTKKLLAPTPPFGPVRHTLSMADPSHVTLLTSPHPVFFVFFCCDSVPHTPVVTFSKPLCGTP